MLRRVAKEGCRDQRGAEAQEDAKLLGCHLPGGVTPAPIMLTGWLNNVLRVFLGRVAKQGVVMWEGAKGGC